MKFSDNELLIQLHTAVSNERNATLVVLNLLRETNDRQLHLKLGYGSLFEFCVKELKYSETSANRRISAMYAMLSVPVIEEKIQSGTLSLDVIAKAQSHIRQKEKISSIQLGQKVKVDQKQRAELFESLSGMSCREAEKELIKQDPEIFDLANKKDSVRQITPELQELKIILDEDMQADIEKLKLLLSHVISGATIKEVLKFVLKESIKKRDLRREAQKYSIERKVKKHNLQNEVSAVQSAGRPTQQQIQNASELEGNSELSTPDLKRHAQPAQELDRDPSGRAQTRIRSEIQVGMPSSESAAMQTGVRIPIAAPIKRAVWKKSQGQCCYQHQGRRCSSRFQLQIDHIIPVAKGGSSDVSNLHLLCRQHNQLKGMAYHP